ncbi:glycoside hydrolase [Hyaloscypha sp. PMI_1271]|nr:glycoside hydrolase [Hyaloscypha sp. PMI_1271]
MKILICVLTLAVVAQGAPAPEPHYAFPNIIDIRCNNKNFAKGTTTIAAGSMTGFQADQAIFYSGPALAYMAKVPAGKTAATWGGSGQVWFKIYEEKPTVSNNALSWPSYKIPSKIPVATPSGEYLLRAEHTAMHLANQLNGAQFYVSCAQITVTGSGAGTPGPLVSFFGACKNADPGIKYNINAPVKNPTNYVPPGPPVWTG